MRRYWITCATLLIALGLAAPTHAERRPEDRREATHVIVSWYEVVKGK